MNTEHTVVNKDDLTPWFDGTLYKPARPGVYMLMSGSSVGYQRWDGVEWSSWYLDVDGAANGRLDSYADTHYQNDNWRGLRNKP